MRKLKRLDVRAEPVDLERWRRAARAAGYESLSAFTRDLLDAQPAPRFVPLEVAPADKARLRAGPAPADDWQATLERIAAGGSFAS
jgi:hypothetical protein